MTTKPTPSTPPTTQSAKPRIPSDETLAIRCLREARKLDALIATAKATLDERVKARADLLASMSPGARKIFDVQMASSAGEEK